MWRWAAGGLGLFGLELNFYLLKTVFSPAILGENSEEAVGPINIPVSVKRHILIYTCF